ncbi:MAG: hypothetical protein GY844_11470 [Bradyrhizobium sp.]|nr:hypothetical protein [Bradyrhizobium sp.]
MPRKRNRLRRAHSEPRPARRRIDPRLTVGDIVFLLLCETWAAVGIGARNGAMAAAIAVLAATARIGPKAARDILLEDWIAGTLTVPTRTGRRVPILLPLAREVVARYLEQRPENAGPWLFVNGEGNQLHHNDIDRTFAALGRKCGMPGTRLPTRCLQFFDRSFDGEDEDRAAVVALSGWRDRTIDSDVARADVDEAARDADRLRAVLEDNHELAGTAGRFLGARGIEYAAGTRTIFVSQDRVPLKKSPAMTTDPVCIALAAVSWPRRGKKALRMELKRLHFDHVDGLRRAGRIRLGEMAYLFSCATRTVNSWIWARTAAEKTPQRLAEEARWREEAPAMYLARPRGQTPAQFHDRLTVEHRCTVPFVWMLSVLQQARVLGRRPRSKPVR